MNKRKRIENFQRKTNEEKQWIRRRQQYIAEQYWKNKRRQENNSGKFSPNLCIVIVVVKLFF